MRILVVSDIHSNWQALAVVRERFDVCLCVGDVVDYGPDPAPCVNWVREHALHTVRGNHDHAVAQRVPPQRGRGLKKLAAEMRPRHWELLDSEALHYLEQLPVTLRFRLDGKSFYMVHGTPRDPLDEYLRDDANAWRERLSGQEADFVLVGHTHRPFHLDIDGMQVINPGSIGQPRDDDPRASYAIIEDGEVELKRLPYDIGRTLERYRELDLPPDAIDIAASYLNAAEVRK